MDVTIFKKMKTKSGMIACVLFPPPEYPTDELLLWGATEQVEFLHLFISSKEDLEMHFSQATSKLKPGGLFWVSYPKGKGKNKPNINRDSLWDFVVTKGYHPVSQVALSPEWSAVRLKENEKEIAYIRPNKV